jgi:hypothetical protein
MKLTRPLPNAAAAPALRPDLFAVVAVEGDTSAQSAQIAASEREKIARAYAANTPLDAKLAAFFTVETPENERF